MWAKSAGWSAALTWIIYRAKTALGFREPLALTLKPSLAQFPVVVRLGGSTDLNVFCQIFQIREYSRLSDLSSLRLILDLGANVGYTSAYFLSAFPDATVVAVEPDPKNFGQCSGNLAPYGGRAKVVKGAVWSTSAKLAISGATMGAGWEWARRVQPVTGDEKELAVEGWDIPSLMQLAGAKTIDLLKCDIEGSELELFGDNSSSWLPNVRNICIELHGADCERVFFEALKGFDYDLETSGELTMCRNLRPKNQPLKAG
jgi:FkbM family methyltransferase